MPDQVPENIKTIRSNELISLCKIKKENYEKELIGTTQEVLIEETICKDGETSPNVFCSSRGI